jgi:sulfoxide reductase catalytic subunit YedY
VVFFLAPFQILTGAAQSPAIEARFPWFVRAFGGRQWARSLHFLALLAFLVSIVIHVFMVVVHGFGKETAKMIFGAEVYPTAATIITIAALVGLAILHWAATEYTLAYPRSTQRILGKVTNNTRRLLLHRLKSRQDYSKVDLTPEHRVNGKPPTSEEYKIMAAHNFADYKLEVGGLVERPMTFTLEDLRTFPTRQTQRVFHNCVQGWTSIGEWSGVPLRQIVELVRPRPEVRYICFWTMQDSGRDEPSAPGGGQFYEVIDLELAYHPQTLLAYDMNGGPLPIKHGAPLRLRLETHVGFKMAKWIERIEFLDDYSHIGEGMGDGAKTTCTTTRTWGSEVVRVTIPENTVLTEAQKERVLERIKERNFICGSCGSEDFRVGEALEMGFLFLDEKHGNYMVALTCENPDCNVPRTGIRLHDSVFLWDE